MRQAALGIDPPALSFEEGAGGVRVDLRRLVAGRLVASASSGGGKGWLARWLLEATCAEIPHLVLDWDGEYPSLKTVHPYVWVGDLAEGADLPASASAARAQCRRLMAAKASVVLDLSPLDADARREVAALWLDELMSRNVAPHPRLVVADEAHELAPQGAEVASTQAMRRLVAQGRKRGYGAVVLTQRLSKLHKDCAESANRMIGRTILDVDVRRSADELGMDKGLAQELRRLRPGQWYAFGPAIQEGDGVVLCRAGETRSAYPDGTLAAMGVPTPAAIAAALKGLEAAAEGPSDEAGLQELREEAERLRAALKAAREGNVSEPADIARAVASATAPLKDSISALELRLARSRHHARAILLDLGEVPEEVERIDDPPAVQTSASAAASPSSAESEDEGGEAASEIDAAQVAMLEYLAGKGDVAKEDLAKALGYSNARSGKFRPFIADLRRRGLVEYPRERFVRRAGGAR